MILEILKIIYIQIFSRSSISRIPEERIIMSDPEHVRQFTDAGKLGGEMTPLYYYRIQSLKKIILSGDKVLDLGCGSGQLLTLIAECFPDAQFVGIDLSETMLAQAIQTQKNKGLTNLKFQKLDITKLSDGFEKNSFDVIISTDALHHLPTLIDLQQTLQEVKKVLKLEGRFSFFDFERMKTHTSMRLLVDTTKHNEPLIKDDLFQSLRAAFTRDEFIENLTAADLTNYKVKTTFPLFLMTFFTPHPTSNHDLSSKKAKDIFRSAMTLRFKFSYYFFLIFSRETTKPSTR